MKVGVLSDLHGNLPALERVLEDVGEVDRLVCAGDVVGYNPWHAACVTAMRDPDASDAVPDRLAEAAGATGDVAGVPTVQGNHDRAVAAGRAPGFNSMARAGVEHAREQLAEEQLAWLDDLPTERTLADGRLKVVHGHPDDPDHYTTPREFEPNLLADEDVLVMGHTHVQHCETYDEGVVLNPGSVGQPRDGDPRAAYAEVDLSDLSVETRRVEYDVDAVVDEVTRERLPKRIGERLREGR